MPRIKRGIMTRKHHRKILNRAKGYWGSKSRKIRQANEAVMHAGQYAYRDRRVRKRVFRRLWIARINAAARALGLTYSRLVNGLDRAGVKVDRKIMAELAISHGSAFGAIVEQARAALA